jgi:hypothetical protein
MPPALTLEEMPEGPQAAGPCPAVQPAPLGKRATQVRDAGFPSGFKGDLLFSQALE